MLIVFGFVDDAGAQAEYDGHFEVRSGVAEVENGVYYLDALIDLKLASEAVEALESNFTLTISVEVEILHRLRLWLDFTEVEVSRRTLLTYDQLTRRYVVRNINTGDRATFATLAVALDRVGHIEQLPIVDAALLEPDRRYDIRVRAALETDELPGPLSFLAFWRNDYSIRSDWLRWRLQDK